MNTSRYALPWNAGPAYWLCLWADSKLPPAFTKTLQDQGAQVESSHYYFKLPKNWGEDWQRVRTLIREKGPAVGLHAALMASETQPGFTDIRHHEKPLAVIDGEALLENRFASHLQKVVDKRDKVFGYEAFGRGFDTQGALIDGTTLFKASKGLQIEHILDRHLHVLAIDTFVDSERDGFLFINMLPGFIHRPEKYLQGLAETVQSHGMLPKYVVIDIALNGLTFEPRHLKSIVDYCALQGYSTALDDIHSYGLARELLNNIRPDFIKLDIKFVQQVEHPQRMQELRQVVEDAHSVGCTVIAEGVETDRQHELLHKIGVDLFQGYLFGKPEAVEPTKKKAKA
jgi:EAL domain-containing protein (putative c-di-GMP-specific phosphodiesterase class I)